MADDPRDALGTVIRSLREGQGLTQEELGRRAGYRSGAGVSISRLESGLTTPSPAKFVGLAEALGLTPEELDARAARWSAPDGADAPAPGLAGGPHPAPAPPSSKVLKARAQAVQAEVDRRRSTITTLTGAFNEHHDRARDAFFLRFVALAERVEGAPPVDPTPLRDEAEPDAAHRLETTADGVRQVIAEGPGRPPAGGGRADLYRRLVGEAANGVTNGPSALSGLTGTLAGAAGGTAVLTALVAAPGLTLLAGGLLLMERRNRRRQQELAAQLDEAEAELAASQPGVEALETFLPLAAGALDYIATHAGHALDRWEGDLGPGPTSWAGLGEAGRRRFDGFVAVAAAQVEVVTIDVQGLLTARGPDRDDLVQRTGAVLAHARTAIEAQV